MRVFPINARRDTITNLSRIARFTRTRHAAAPRATVGRFDNIAVTKGGVQKNATMSVHGKAGKCQKCQRWIQQKRFSYHLSR